MIIGCAFMAVSVKPRTGLDSSVNIDMNTLFLQKTMNTELGDTSRRMWLALRLESL